MGFKLIIFYIYTFHFHVLFWMSNTVIVNAKLLYVFSIMLIQWLVH